MNPKGYIYMHADVSGRGVTKWQESLTEVLRLARATGRTLITPCVRDGQLVPCPGPDQPRHSVDCKRQKLAGATTLEAARHARHATRHVLRAPLFLHC